jgi:PST family polysaccharide transporter
MSSKYKNILSNKEGKVILTNFSYLFLLQIAGYLFPLLTMPYLARVIGADGFGRIAIASAVIMWIQTISDWGFNYTATRDVAKNRDDKDKVSHILSNVIWAKFILLFLSFIILLLLIYFVPIFRENYLVVLITFLMVPGHILFPDWFFQALERMKYITILNLLSKLLFTIAIFVFIKEKTDYIYQPLFISTFDDAIFSPCYWS